MSEWLRSKHSIEVTAEEWSAIVDATAGMAMSGQPGNFNRFGRLADRMLREFGAASAEWLKEYERTTLAEQFTDVHEHSRRAYRIAMLGEPKDIVNLTGLVHAADAGTALTLIKARWPGLTLQTIQSTPAPETYSFNIYAIVSQ